MILSKINLVQPIIGDDEVAAVTRILRSGQLAQGPEVAQFEEEFAAMCGVRHAVAVNSGTAAIHCALEAVGVADGDEVITTPFTFAATATPILMQRAVPRFVDIDSRTFNIDIDAAFSAVTPRTKAVVAVDLFGHPISDKARAAFNERSILVIEDACQAIGASYNNRVAGGLGDVGAFSMYATKNLMTGEGGMVTTDDDEIAKATKRFRQHGQGERYEYLSLGYNYRMTDISAAIGRVQLSRLGEISRRRRANAATYDKLLSCIPGLVTPYTENGVEHAYHQYSVLIDDTATNNGADRDCVRKDLMEQGIGTGIYYPTPLHLNPLFASFANGVGSFRIAERCAAQVLALPIHPGLELDDIERVSAAIRKAVGA